MNTNSIKSFAKKARILLLDGVATRLKFWGFEADGTVQQEVQPTQGGYTFRGSVSTDATVPAKWNKLKKRLDDKQAVLDCVEEAAYTWFNRLMAIKILEKNGYVPELLGYANEMRTPRIVQNAKNGEHALTKQSDINLLVEYLQEDKEDLAFALLITDFCNKNSVLHNVFGKIDDYTELLLPLNLTQKDGVLDLINSDAISDEDYKEVELIGWLYQFYISDRKDQVFADFKKNKKARAEDIPAATQIFTPKWIVKYMVENTVGKIYLDYEPTSSLGSEMRYLVVNETDNEVNFSATGKKSIISDLKELTLIDPACGSGHILVTGFELLFTMYREEGYTAKQAVLAILENNLFGLDIDDRAMQLARFAVLLKAAKYDSEILNKSILPHIYSFPEEVHIATEELQLFLGANGHSIITELKDALVLLNQGKNIGSALKIDISEDAYAFVKQQFFAWNEKALAGNLDIEEVGIWQRLQQHLEVLLVMGIKYTAVVANPPYMGQGNMNGQLKDYVNKHYPVTKSDLMTVFMEVIPNLTVENSRFALINLPSWMFLSSFEKIREQYVDNFSFDSLLHMGRGIFGIDFGSVAFSIKKTKNDNAKGSYFRLHERNFQHIHFQDIEKLFLYSNNNENYKYDFNLYRGEEGITEIPKEGTESGVKLFYPFIFQNDFLKIPGSPISYWISKNIINAFQSDKAFDKLGNPKVGMQTSNNAHFLKRWFEINYLEFKDSVSKKWIKYIKGGNFRRWFGNLEFVLYYNGDGQELKKTKNATVLDESFLQNDKCTWNDIASKDFNCRIVPHDTFYDISGHCFFPENETNKYSLLAFANSKLFNNLINLLNPTLHFQVGDVKKIPVNTKVISDYRIVDLSQTNVKISELDWNNRESSWDFEKSPLLVGNSSLSGSFERWKKNVTQDFFKLHSNEELLNKIFIEIYGLQDELNQVVALKEITVLQDELDRNVLEQLEPVFREKGKDAIELPIKKDEVLSQFVSYCIGVFLGRYRLDKPGLNIAHPNPTDEELASYQYNGQLMEIDEDGIVPLMGENCAFPDDVLVRLKQMLLAVWGEETLVENINFLQECLGMDLHKWLTEKFWGYHTSMYKKKPIYWLFTTNPKKPQNAAFKVLVYMHRMDKYTVQKIQRNYLHPHQEYINQEIERLRSNELNLSKQELKRLETLMQWQLECRDYNEVLKELANQQIEFDLDDGVDVNYAKFHGAVAVI